MWYNLYIKPFVGPGSIRLFGLVESQLKEFVDVYEYGKGSFFINGETYNFGELQKVLIYDTSKQPALSVDLSVPFYLKDYFEKSARLYNLNFQEVAEEFGINVTAYYIKGSYGFKKEKTVKENLPVINNVYVNEFRIEELKKIKNTNFDLTKLIRLSEELNDSNHYQNYFAVGALVRAILDHVPPIFNCKKFDEVANNYKAEGNSKSFSDSMKHLNESMRKISDSLLHSQIRKNETLPNDTQVDCKRDLDVLIGEIVRILK